MGLFSKNNNKGFVINTDNDGEKISGDKNLAPHAITPEEVASPWFTGDDKQKHENDRPSALEALKKRMGDQKETSADGSSNDANKDEIFKEALKNIEEKNDGNKIKNADIDKNSEKSDIKPDKPDHSEKTLLEKLKPYTVDEQGHNVANTDEPLYKLESVAEILKNNSKKYLEKLSQKYDVTVETLGKDDFKPESKNEQNTVDIKPQAKTNIPLAHTPTVAFEKMVDDSEKNEENQILKGLFLDEDTADIDNDVRVPDISDIDNKETGISLQNTNTDTATIRFTPIADSRGNTDHISISNITKHIDLDYDVSANESLSQSVTPQLEQSEFESFSPVCEVTDDASAKKITRLLKIKKRSLFISSVVSVLSIILTLVFLIPPLSDLIIGKPRGSMLFCGALLLISTLANINMFADFKNLFKKRCSFDITASLCAIVTLGLSVCAAATNSNAYYSILLCEIILAIRSLGKFKEISAILSNLKQFTKSGSKNAVTLLNDPATTFAMAKNAIDGDTLVAAHRKTDFINDFVKYYSYSAKLSGKVNVIFILTVIIALLTGSVAFFYYKNLFNAFYCAAAITFISAIPSAFMIDALPLSAAAKKLNAKSAAISGIYGAKKIESANAAVVSICDIFPEGTVSMYSMKVLSDNNIDHTILKAASLTAAVKSPLEAIFKNIAGTNSSYSIPSSDTVKYEKRLGISGWVDNEFLFIGNRSLMTAHGIELPSIEIDKKILRKGYFPVYVATTESACALIVIQYNVRPDIAAELRKLTELGITLLVDNCDPNVNEEMLCDYFGLYSDSVKIMTNAGVHMYANATSFVENCSAPAVFKGSNLSYIKIINCASMIKKSNRLLTVMYIVFAVLGLLYFIYASFSGLNSVPSAFMILMYGISTAVISIIGFLIRKP